jgi:hypothetical protein
MMKLSESIMNRVEPVDNNQTEVMGKNQTITVSQDQTETIGGSLVTNINTAARTSFLNSNFTQIR